MTNRKAVLPAVTFKMAIVSSVSIVGSVAMEHKQAIDDWRIWAFATNDVRRPGRQ
jgi:hypothetical protein